MAEPIDEVRAILELAHEKFPGSNRWPLGPEREGNPYQVIAESTMWPPVKLELLRQAIEGGRAEADELLDIARSLAIGDNPDETAAELIDAIDRNRGSGDAGGTPRLFDPLGRTSLGGPHPPGVDLLLQKLDPLIECNIIAKTELCDSDPIEVEGQQAVSIYSEVESCQPPDDFRDIVVPERWPLCGVLNLLFTAMNEHDPPGKTLFPVPDDASYSHRLREFVDFGLTFVDLDILKMVTDLDVTVVDDTGRLDVSPALSATYDLNMSQDGKIVFDRGFLSAQSDTLNGTTTLYLLKQVWFESGINLPGTLVCAIWSYATFLMTLGCVGP